MHMFYNVLYSMEFCISWHCAYHYGTGTGVKNVIGYDSGQTRVNNLKMALQIVGNLNFR